MVFFGMASPFLLGCSQGAGMTWIEPPCLLQGKKPGAAPEAGRVPASGMGGGAVRVTGGEFAWRLSFSPKIRWAGRGGPVALGAVTSASYSVWGGHFSLGQGHRLPFVFR